MSFYRLLLRVYPASFRAAYADEMAAIFRARWQVAGLFARAGLCVDALQEVAMNVPALHWDMLKQDLRHTLRTLRRSPSFALTAILVTALGVGANTAALSVADFVLLRPLPFANPDRLVRLCEGPKTGAGWGCMNELSPANYRDFNAMSTSFDGMGAFTGGSVNLSGTGDPQRVEMASLTTDVLPVLGVAPAIGRALDPRDRTAVVLSDRLWRSQFGGDRSVIGRTIHLDGAPYTIVGVMPAGFYFPTRDAQLWTPLTLVPDDFTDRGNTYLQSVARLKAGTTFDQARAELDAIATRLGREHPDTNADTGISFFRVQDNMSPRFRVMLVALGAASVCVLLLTCANLANLLLARAAGRDRELAVRAALGAGRERLMRQLMTESVILTLAGGAAGLVVAGLAIPLFSGLVPSTLPLASEPTLDVRMFLFAAAFTALTALGFGLVPAIRAGRRTAFGALRDNARTSGGQKQRVRALLVAIELAVSIVLLISSGLLIRAVWRVQAVDPGFSADHVLTLSTALARPQYDDPIRRAQFCDRVLTQVRALPGVQSAAYISGLPMLMTGIVTAVQVPGFDARTSRAEPVSQRWISSLYFKTMGIPIRQGRDVEDTDTGDRNWVAVVSASFVQRYWPGQNPIGKTFRHLDVTRTVIGVVGDVKVRGLERTSEPQVYLPLAQVPDPAPTIVDPRKLVIRRTSPDDTLVPAIRQIVSAIDRTQPVSDIRAMDDIVAGETESRRGQLRVLLVFAAVAAVLSAVGIYGLLAYMVSQRSQEIAVRLALGAEPARVSRMILRDGLRLAMYGLVPGLLGAYAAGRAMSALLFGIGSADPATFATAVALSLVMTLAGSSVPALRAMRIMPSAALKAD